MPTTGERLAHLETLIEDPELGLIGHVKRLEGKIDLLLGERAARRPLIGLGKSMATGFAGAIAAFVVGILTGTLKPHWP